MIVADYDGVIVVPAEVLPNVIQLATDKVARENGSRAAQKRRISGDVFAKYGVL
jgi:4-hydroxy-4-methyl-2-oxoglutarate aldolase